MGTGNRVQVAGRAFSEAELREIAEIVAAGNDDASRTQLAYRVCERLDWRRPTGVLKARECRDLLERLAWEGRFAFAGQASGAAAGCAHADPVDACGRSGRNARGDGGTVRHAQRGTGRREICACMVAGAVGRYHYLGYRVPYGAHVRYLAYVSEPQRVVVAALQVSSAAWRLAARDRWIGWDERVRGRNLQRVVNHSRFVILPRVRVRNLASHLLSVLVRRLPRDWALRSAGSGKGARHARPAVRGAGRDR